MQALSSKQKEKEEKGNRMRELKYLADGGYTDDEGGDHRSML